MEKWPTEYKLQYGCKGAPTVPVLQAQQVLDRRHDPACPNKTDDKDWSVESVDGDSCDAAVESDRDSSTKQEPTVMATHRPAAVKKRQQLQKHKQKARTQFSHKKPSRVSQNATTTQRAVTTKTKSRPQVAPNKTTVKQTIEQDDDNSDSDTDSQTGQKIQQPRQTIDHHYKCVHKKMKKRNVKRKLIWPLVTEYQSQYKTKEAPTVDDGDDKVCYVHTYLSVSNQNVLPIFDGKYGQIKCSILSIVSMVNKGAFCPHKFLNGARPLIFPCQK